MLMALSCLMTQESPQMYAALSEVEHPPACVYDTGITPNVCRPVRSRTSSRLSHDTGITPNVGIPQFFWSNSQKISVFSWLSRIFFVTLRHIENKDNKYARNRPTEEPRHPQRGDGMGRQRPRTAGGGGVMPPVPPTSIERHAPLGRNGTENDKPIACQATDNQ